MNLNRFEFKNSDQNSILKFLTEVSQIKQKKANDQNQQI